MLKCEMNIVDYDVELWQVMEQEKVCQEEYIELIVFENYISLCVMQVQGFQLINKYVEGYLGKCYYGGCEYVDVVEQLVIDCVKELFGVDYVNVQLYFGFQVNFVVYIVLLQLGDIVLGMNLVQGGYLIYGFLVNFFGKLYNIVFYGIDEFGKIDYDEMVKLVKEYKLKMIIGGFFVYFGVVDWVKMCEIVDSIGVYLFVDMVYVVGLIVVGVYLNLVLYVYVVIIIIYKILVGLCGGLILVKGGDEELYKKLNFVVFLSVQGGLLMYVIVGKVVVLKEVMELEFKVYQQQVVKNVKVMVEVFLNCGYKVVFGGIENYLFLLDLVDKNLIGKEVDVVLGCVNIIVNKNSVLNDFKSLFVIFGICIGFLVVICCGFKEVEVKELVGWMCDVLDNINDEVIIECVKVKVLDICVCFLVYV